MSRSRSSESAPIDEGEADSPAEEAETDNYWDYCPNCGHRLVNEGCKYRCTRCRYFMSCSDFD